MLQLGTKRFRTLAISVVLGAPVFIGLVSKLETDATVPMHTLSVVEGLTRDVLVRLGSKEIPPSGSVALSWAAEGRVLPDPNGGLGLVHEWPGIVMLARFEGDQLLIEFEDFENRFRLSVDGRPVAIVTRPGNAIASLSGLGSGAHEVRLEKLSESGSPSRIGGLFVPSGGRALSSPVLPAARIDVFGDSDTVGYGIAHRGRDCLGDDVFLNTDVTAAYPSLLAMRFGAVPMVVARSGIGVVRNYDSPAPGATMAMLYDRVVPSLSSPDWTDDVSAWITLVEVGGNDFSQPLRSGEPWAGAAALSADFARSFEALLRDLLRKSPTAPIVVLSVPDPGVERPQEPLAVAEALRAEGAPVSVVIVPDLDRTACDWHPSVADHRLIARTVENEIERLITSGQLEVP